MFPEDFADKWIRRLTKRGDTVLDPFSGRGTTALTALLLGRDAVACDVNEVAFCLTAAKAAPPPLKKLLTRIDDLRRDFDNAAVFPSAPTESSEFFNQCFEPRTLEKILFIRSHLNWRESKTDNMIAALTLGSLHGDAGVNSPYFSNQMPRTISMNPDYSIRYWRQRNQIAPARDIFGILSSRAIYRYKSPIPQGKAYIFNTDMRDLRSKKTRWPKISCVITSPPYLNVTSFEEDQWLRLWFLGAPSRPSKGRISKDDRHLRSNAYWTFIGDMWKSLGSLVTREGHVVIRIGSRSESSDVMRQELIKAAELSGRKVRLISSRESELKRRQTNSFRPGSEGCRTELDCHYQFD